MSYISGRHSSRTPLLYRRSSHVEMSQVVFNSSAWKLYPHRRDGTGGALKKLEPKDLIVFPHQYRRDGTHWGDRTHWGDCTGGAKKRGHFILKRDRTRCHHSHDYGTSTRYVVAITNTTMMHESSRPASPRTDYSCRAKRARIPNC